MIVPKLAVRNLLGAGIRTWLNVIVLSFSFVAIIWSQGIYEGMGRQIEDATIAALYGGGQYWHINYDPFDPISLKDAHGPLTSRIEKQIEAGQATALLLRPGTIYPNGRFRSVLLKGIDPNQAILSIPAGKLRADEGATPALVGTRMAESAGLNKGDLITVQWRDVNGTFDAQEVQIVEIMKTTVQEIDNSQLWLPLEKLREMTGMPGQATVTVLRSSAVPIDPGTEWVFKDLTFLLRDTRAMVDMKKIGGSVMYVILLFLAMLAIFDTQILSIYRRRKEMGTLMALGMTRGRLIQLFTFEGSLHGVLAAIIAAAYGIPLLTWTAVKGYALPSSTDDYGMAIGEKIFPVYTVGLVLGTIVLVLIVTTIVSFLPTRKIARLNPTDALRGRAT